MEFYTLNFVIEESYKDAEGDFITQNYARGVFTSLSKAIDGVMKIIEGKADIDNLEQVKEIFIMKYNADCISSGVGVMGWLENNGIFWKYFEQKDGKFVTYKRG